MQNFILLLDYKLIFKCENKYFSKEDICLLSFNAQGFVAQN